MRTSEVGRTGVHLTRLGFGASVIGNLYRVVSDEAATGAVSEAWDLGIRYFDTAPHYGLGLSERRLGIALGGHDRDEWVLSTKVGRLLVPNDRPTGADTDGFAVRDDWRREWDFSRDGVLRSIEGSLERLGTDRIDIVYIHDPEDHVDEALAGAAPALTDLRDQGVIGAWGVGTNRSDVPVRFVRETGIDVVMLAGRFTLLEQGAQQKLLPWCLSRGVAVVGAGVFNSGLLSKRRAADDTKFDYEPAPASLIARVNDIAVICESFGVDLPTAALAFPLTHPAITAVVVGMRHRGQVQSTTAMFDTPIPTALWSELGARRLVNTSWVRS